MSAKSVGWGRVVSTGLIIILVLGLIGSAIFGLYHSGPDAQDIYNKKFLPVAQDIHAKMKAIQVSRRDDAPEMVEGLVKTKARLKGIDADGYPILQKLIKETEVFIDMMLEVLRDFAKGEFNKSDYGSSLREQSNKIKNLKRKFLRKHNLEQKD
jgi:hypothetical protein